MKNNIPYMQQITRTKLHNQAMPSCKKNHFTVPHIVRCIQHIRHTLFYTTLISSVQYYTSFHVKFIN